MAADFPSRMRHQSPAADNCGDHCWGVTPVNECGNEAERGLSSPQQGWRVTGLSTAPGPLSIRRCERIRGPAKTASSPQPSPPKEEREKRHQSIFSQLL